MGSDHENVSALSILNFPSTNDGVGSILTSVCVNITGI